jgi:hypothetical protein
MDVKKAANMLFVDEKSRLSMSARSLAIICRQGMLHLYENIVSCARLGNLVVDGGQRSHQSWKR